MPSRNIRIRLLRNATVLLSLGDKTILVDPMLSKKSALDPIPWTNNVRNPTVDLTVSEEALKQIITSTDAVLLTHLHPDHWDEAAKQLLTKNIPLICQPEDAAVLQQQGFSNLRPGREETFSDIKITRVAAQHGHGELAEKMAPVSGYVLTWGEVVIYVAGDTVWYEGFQQVMDQFRPDVVIVNSGAARFNFGEPITMTANDVVKTAMAAKDSAKVIVVHLEAVNHCYLTRAALKDELAGAGVAGKCFVPGDGEAFTFEIDK